MPPFARPGSFLDRVFNGSKEERSVPFPEYRWSYGQGLPPSFKPQASLRAMNDNVYLRRAVLTIAMEIARTNFQLRKKKADGGKVQYVEKHDSLTALATPQPTKTGKSLLSSMDLKLVTGMHLMLNGEAFWLLDGRKRINKSPTMIEPLLPQYVFEIFDKNHDLVQYAYRIPEKEILFDAADVVHFKLPDPENWRRGASPVQPIRWAVDTHKEADILNAKRLQNNAVPTGIITSDANLNESQIERLRGQWNQMYRGADNAGKVAVMPKGQSFEAVQQSNAEMQFVEGKKMNRDEILANYGMGLELLGQTESQTRANAEAAIFIFERFGVLPLLEKFADTLNNDYLPAFPGTEDLQFTFPDPVPENLEEKRANATALFGLGALTPNEVREQFGKEALTDEGMDSTYMPINVMPVGVDPIAPNVAA